MREDKVVLYDYNGFLYLGGPRTLRQYSYFKDSMGKWDSKEVAWVFPALYQCVLDIEEHFPEVVARSESWLVKEIIEEEFGYAIDYKVEYPKYPHLRSYQRVGVSFLINNPYHVGLLGLSPGLGKTLTSLTAAIETGSKRVLVVCPKILVPSWIREVEKWTDYSAHNFWQETPDEHEEREGVFVTTYETVTKYAKDYSRKKHFWDVLIIDESVMIKNLRANSPRASNRAKAILDIRKNSDYVWLLSGSPVSKYIDDLFGQFRCMLPKVFTSYWRFVEKHCFIERSIWDTAGYAGGQITGTLPTINPRERFKDLMLMRHMDEPEVGEDIPEYIVVDVPITLMAKDRKEYDQLSNKFANETNMGNKQMLKTFDRMGEFVAIAPSARKGKTEFLLSILSNDVYELPMLIWTYYRSTSDDLYEALTKKGYSVGRVYGNMDDGDKIIQDYVNGVYDILILSIAVGKYGLTLTNTKTVVSFEKTYDADAMYQSTYRVRRIGLKHEPVYINLFVEDTIEEGFRDNLELKLATIAAVTGADEYKLLSLIGR